MDRITVVQSVATSAVLIASAPILPIAIARDYPARPIDGVGFSNSGGAAGSYTYAFATAAEGIFGVLTFRHNGTAPIHAGPAGTETANTTSDAVQPIVDNLKPAN